MHRVMDSSHHHTTIIVKQQMYGFFTSSYNNYRETTDEWGTMPSMIGHGLLDDQNANGAPLGSGVLLLAGLGLAYAMRNKNRK